jgi:hypothetical protein
MKTLWITYSWADNKDEDIDFIAQELDGAGVVVILWPPGRAWRPGHATSTNLHRPIGWNPKPLPNQHGGD